MTRFLLIGLLIGLLSCQPHYQLIVQSESIAVLETGQKPNLIDSMVMPYQIELSKEMDEVIAFAENDFTKGRPNGTLNNWSASCVLSHQLQNTNLEIPVMVLLNVGGLRNPISKGAVTIGDIYKLMPFDNEVVWVEMPIESLEKIERYLIQSGGEPIAGTNMSGGKLHLPGDEKIETFWVITSDYLMNGGDHMDFFQDRLGYRYADILLRDLFIEQAKSQETLIYSDEQRIEM